MIVWLRRQPRVMLRGFAAGVVLGARVLIVVALVLAARWMFRL